MLKQDNSAGEHLIDPDPISITMLFISAATLALQFIQVARAGPSAFKRPKGSERQLPHIEGALEDAITELDRTIRAIERGTRSPDKEFYDIKFGIGLGIMRLEAQWHREYSQNLHQAFGKVGALSMYINNLIASDEALAAEIGERMLGLLSDSSSRLNLLLVDGAPNRAVIAECNQILRTCNDIVTSLIAQRRSN